MESAARLENRTSTLAPDIVTQSVELRRITKMTCRIARSSASVLLTGESGTGKELFAQLIHQASRRADQPFVKVNCAALSENLIESELFGHKRGAFTDAIEGRMGRFELANGGTLLLDEISEVPPSTQVKLLRVLEESEFERVGSNETIKTDVRVIATSNRDLGAEVDAGNFRLDLFHRLSVIQIQVPALRDRSEDIPLLAMHFVSLFKDENEIEVRGFTKSAMQKLAQYSWPGNVRELRNVVHRACILTDRPLIDEHCIQHLEYSEPGESETSLPDAWLETKLVDIEKQIILAAIGKYRNKRLVAEVLGVSPRTLTNKLRLYREAEQLQNDVA